MKEIVILIFGFFAVIFSFFKIGQENQKSKENKKQLKKAIENAKFRQKLKNISVDAKRKYLQQHFGRKK